MIHLFFQRLPKKRFYLPSLMVCQKKNEEWNEHLAPPRLVNQVPNPASISFLIFHFFWDPKNPFPKIHSQKRYWSTPGDVKLSFHSCVNESVLKHFGCLTINPLFYISSFCRFCHVFGVLCCYATAQSPIVSTTMSWRSEMIVFLRVSCGSIPTNTASKTFRHISGWEFPVVTRRLVVGLLQWSPRSVCRFRVPGLGPAIWMNWILKGDGSSHKFLHHGVALPGTLSIVGWKMNLTWRRTKNRP